MKYLIALLALGASVVTARPVAAEEFPHLEFARGLRARNFTDLALDYLTKLGLDPNLPPAVARLLPLEIARASLDLAGAESDPERRIALYDQARQRFESFLRANAQLPEAVPAHLDLAGIAVQQARDQYTQIPQQDGPPRLGALKAVRGRFEEAGRRLQEAKQRISAAGGSPAVKQANIDADFEIARNRLDQMTTFDLDRESLPRSELGRQALLAFKTLAKQDPANPTCWLARAWVIRCYNELDSLPEAVEAYKSFDKEAAGKPVEPAPRVARWHYLQVLVRRDPGGKDLPNNAELLKTANDWLRDYAGFRRTPEGQGVRYQLARHYRREAENGRDLRADKVRDLFSQAERLYAALGQEDGEYSERSRLHRVSILVKQKPELAREDIGKLDTFEKCYLRAQMESALLGEEGKPPGADATRLADAKKAEEQRQRHYRNIVAALDRGFTLAGPDVPARDRIDARFLLIYYLLLTGEPRRAAGLGDELARTYPHSVRAATAGAYALHAYAQILNEQEKAFAPGGELDADRVRLRSLAQYLEATWPADVAADAARYQLGLLALRPKNYPEAVAALARVSPNYSQYAQAQFQLAGAALGAHKDKIAPPLGQPPWEEQAAAAFRRISEPAGSDPEAERVYLYAKIELLKIDYAARKYNDMEALLANLRERLERERDPKVKNELTTALDALAVYAKYGQADAEFRSTHVDRYARVRALVDPIVAQHQAKQLPPLDPKLLQGILGLSLRANVLDGQTARAKEVLELLQLSAGDFASGNAILIDLVQQLRGQLDELRKKGPNFQTEVDKTVAKFAAFLDELARQPLPTLKPEVIRFLAYSYSGLDKHAEAAALLAKIAKPAKLEDEKFYNAARLLYVHELRLAKKYDEAERALHEVRQTEYGKKSLDLKKEEAQLLEDQEKFAPAANGWNQMLNEIKKLKNTNPQLADQYNDCLFHHIHCTYQYAVKSPDEAKKRKYVQRAAHLIASIETGDPKMGGLKERYQEYLDKEPVLKAEYDALMKKQNRPTP